MQLVCARDNRRGVSSGWNPEGAELVNAGRGKLRVERSREGPLASSTRADLESRLRSEGLSPTGWANDPGYRYEPHSHPYEKVLYCVSGSITFHTADGDVMLAPGDRLELDPGVEHGATVGESGVECIEGARRVRT